MKDEVDDSEVILQLCTSGDKDLDLFTGYASYTMILLYTTMQYCV